MLAFKVLNIILLTYIALVFIIIHESSILRLSHSSARGRANSFWCIIWNRIHSYAFDILWYYKCSYYYIVRINISSFEKNMKQKRNKHSKQYRIIPIFSFVCIAYSDCSLLLRSMSNCYLNHSNVVRCVNLFHSSSSRLLRDKQKLSLLGTKKNHAKRLRDMDINHDSISNIFSSTRNEVISTNHNCFMDSCHIDCFSSAWYELNQVIKRI